MQSGSLMKTYQMVLSEQLGTKSIKGIVKHKFKTKSTYLLQIYEVQLSDTLKLSISYPLSTKVIRELVRSWRQSQFGAGSRTELSKNRFAFPRARATTEPRHYVTVYVSSFLATLARQRQTQSIARLKAVYQSEERVFLAIAQYPGLTAVLQHWHYQRNIL